MPFSALAAIMGRVRINKTENRKTLDGKDLCRGINQCRPNKHALVDLLKYGIALQAKVYIS